MAGSGRGELFVLSAPSGTGKTTIIQAMQERLVARGDAPLVFSVSHTTRPARPGERDGVDYHFVDRATFEARAEAGDFLEHATVHGNLYGTHRDSVERELVRGRDVLLDVDVQGARAVLGRVPSVGILVLPPSYAELARRLARRGSEDPATQRRRLSVSLSEIESYELYDYAMINRRMEDATETLTALILAHRHRISRVEPQIRHIVDDFRREVGVDDGTGDP